MATTKTQRKPRTDSATAMVQAAQNAMLPDLRPPPHVQLSAAAEPYFADIVRARARGEWNPHQLTIAAQLAECMAEQVEVAGELLLEGRVVRNAKGTRVANPLVGILEQLARRQMAVGRSLQMIGRVALGDPAANTKQRDLEEKARKLAGEVDAESGEDLLA